MPVIVLYIPLVKQVRFQRHTGPHGREWVAVGGQEELNSLVVMNRGSGCQIWEENGQIGISPTPSLWEQR